MNKFSQDQHFSLAFAVAPAKAIYSSILSGHNGPDTERASGFASAIEQICHREALPFLDAEEAKKLLRSGKHLWWSDVACNEAQKTTSAKTDSVE